MDEDPGWFQAPVSHWVGGACTPTARDQRAERVHASALCGGEGARGDGAGAAGVWGEPEAEERLRAGLRRTREREGIQQRRDTRAAEGRRREGSLQEGWHIGQDGR